MEKHFDINERGCSIRCKLYSNQPRGFSTVTIAPTGFGGHRDNTAAAKFAEVLLGKVKTAAVLVFDWPCHGTDVRKKLSLELCDEYLELVTDYCRQQLGVEDLCIYATSFGGYLTLQQLHRLGTNPYRRILLRCPAIPMYRTLTSSIIKKGELETIENGKETAIGFDRKVPVGKTFLDELREQDVALWDYMDYADELCIVHGTKDEIVPIEDSRSFADSNVIELVEIEGADHRFQNPAHMAAAIKSAVLFLYNK